MIIASHHSPVTNYHHNFEPILSDFFENVKEFKIYYTVIIVLLLLQSVWALPVDAKSFCD